MIDRRADRIFTGFFGSGFWFAITSEETSGYRAAVDRAVSSTPLTIDLYTYGRSRQRICRAWTLIAAGLAGAAPVAAASMGQPMHLAWFVSGTFAGLALCCFATWRWLKLAEEREIRRLGGEATSRPRIRNWPCEDASRPRGELSVISSS